MTSIGHIKNANETSNTSLYNFVNGNIANDYTNPEEKGFLISGNIGAILNSSPCYLNQISDGIILNTTNLTDDSETFINKIKPMKNDWVTPPQSQPKTPLLYCNQQPLSELLPYYPNGNPNVLLNPNCNMQLNGVAAPQVYGGTTAFVNNPAVVNNPNNDIGHEVQTYGIANDNGLRALSQGKYSCEKLTAGHNVPNLSVHKNNNNAYIASPRTFNPDVPLYQVGDWTNEVPNNFIQNFNNSVGKQCS